MRDYLVQFSVVCCHPWWVIWIFTGHSVQFWIAYPYVSQAIYINSYHSAGMTGWLVPSWCFPSALVWLPRGGFYPWRFAQGQGKGWGAFHCLTLACQSIGGHALLMTSSNNEIFYLVSGNTMGLTVIKLARIQPAGFFSVSHHLRFCSGSFFPPRLAAK